MRPKMGIPRRMEGRVHLDAYAANKNSEERQGTRRNREDDESEHKDGKTFTTCPTAPISDCFLQL